MNLKRRAALLAAALACGLLTAPGAAAQERPGAPARVVGRYRLQSNPWVNLHQRLVYEARFKADGPPTGLAGEDLLKWAKAVADYRAYLGRRNPIFDKELISLNATLSGASSDRLPGSVPAAAKRVLEAAMPLYRVAQWGEDDRVNRFWIAVAEPLLASAAEELAEAHAKAYAVPFPKNILVDVTSYAWQFGAYTVGEGASAHAVIASTVKGTQGFAALESLVHEPSHAVVDSDPRYAVGSDLKRASDETGLRPRENLWHAILFYTSGELTRRALARRGVHGYRPFILDMYEGPFRGYRAPLETHWQAYLDGKLSRAEAVKQILVETAPAQR